MKTKALLFLLSLFLFVNLYSQSPDSFNFQAVVRDAGGSILANTQVTAQIKIWQAAPGTTLVFDETHDITTNGFGLVNLAVGSINTTEMNAIDWAAGPYFIEVIVNGTSVSTTQLLSVPYALHAKTAENSTETDPVFTASPANGITSGDITAWNNKLDNEVDGSVTNELQVLTISNDTIYLSDGGFVKLPAGFDGQYSSLTGTPTNVSTFTNDAGYINTEVDGSVTNEIQVLTISNDTIYLSNGGFVKLPAGFDGQYSSLTGAPTNVSTFTNDAGYLTGFTETDPQFTLHPASGITTNNIIDWNAAFSWGDHAAAGYSLTSHTHLDATTSASGFMSAADKTKLNGLENANITAGQGITVSGTYPNISVATAAKPATIRWNVFDTYDNGVGVWAIGNDASMFGGVNPSSWTDGNYRAVHMSSDKDVLKTLCNRKCYPGKNAMLLNEQFYQYSSTTGKVVVALMRVKNTTSAAINWTMYFHYSCYGGWSEYAGVAINGNEVWNSGGANGLLSANVNITIPANRTSTIIVTSTSGPTYTVGSLFLRTCRLAFYNNCLQLPAGLEFVDDLDYATGGWEQ